jgi:hypothetical protein
MSGIESGRTKEERRRVEKGNLKPHVLSSGMERKKFC